MADMSIPIELTSRKQVKWTLSLTPMRWAIAVLLCVLGGVLLAAGTLVPRWQAYLGEQAADDLAAHEAALQAQTMAAHAASAEAARTREAYLRDLKEHPERYHVEWSHTHKPTDEDLQAMAFGGARGEQGLDVAYSGTLWADTAWTRTLDDFRPVEVSVAALGAGVEIAFDSSYEGMTVDGAIVSCDPSPSAGVEAAIEAWAPQSGTYIFDVYVWAVTAIGPGLVNEDSAYVVSGYTSPDMINYDWRGVTEVTVTWSIGLTDAYPRSKTTASIPSGYTYLRDTRQLTAERHWHADADTVVISQASISGGGSVSTNTNYGAGGETDLETELGIVITIEYNTAPDADTDYGSVSVSMGNSEIPLDLSYWTFYQDTDNSDWHWHGDGDPAPAAANINWYTNASTNSISLRRGQNGSGSKSVGEGTSPRAVTVVPRLWKQNKVSRDNSETNGDGWARYDSYDDSAGAPFNVGKYYDTSVGETEQDASVAPSWDGGYEFVESVPIGITVPDRIWRKMTNMSAGVQVSLRKAWLEANGEDVAFTQFTTMQEATGDVLQPVTMHDLVTEFADPPWQDNWMTWARTELNLDKPDGTNRPSDWTAVGSVDVTGEVWTIPAAGGVVRRDLANEVRLNRLKRMNDHLWTGSGDQQEVSDDWPLMTRHDLAIGTTGDDAKWRDSGATPWPGDYAGIDYEDVSDWRALSCMEMAFSGVTEDQTVQLQISYRALSGSNPYYTGAKYKYGPGDGEFSSTWGNTQIAAIDGTLYAETGIVKWDLAPDAGSVPINAELVDSIEIIFPETTAEQTLTFTSFVTTPYAGNGSDEETTRKAHVEPDWFGMRAWLDGMPNYKPSYLYTLDRERVEVGYKHTQQAQHNPDSPLTDDICSLKSLARWYNEQSYAELLVDPTYSSANINAALQDADTNDMATPYCTDYDEDGFCIHVGTDQTSLFGGHVVYCDVILQGGARGIAKRNGARLTDRDRGAAKLYMSLDGGATLDLVNSAALDAQGAFRIGAGKEQAPRTYYLKSITWLPLGSFVNAEEVWAVLANANQSQPALCVDAAGRRWRAINDGGDIRVHWRDNDETAGWIDAGTPFRGGYSQPRIACLRHGDGQIIVSARASAGTVEVKAAKTELSSGLCSWSVVT